MVGIRTWALLAMVELLTLSTVGCEMLYVKDPLLEVVVEQSEGQVRFEFYRTDKSWLSKRRIPASIWSLSVNLPGGMPVWRVVSPASGPGALQVTYGVAPSGFTQEVPSVGAAPPLDPNRPYGVSVRGEGVGAASFVYGKP